MAAQAARDSRAAAAQARRREAQQDLDDQRPNVLDYIGPRPAGGVPAGGVPPAASGASSMAVPADSRRLVADGWESAQHEGGRHRRHAVQRDYVRPLQAGQPDLPDPTNRWDEVEETRARLAAASMKDYAEAWKARVAEEHAEVNHPEYGRGGALHCGHILIILLVVIPSRGFVLGGCKVAELRNHPHTARALSATRSGCTSRSGGSVRKARRTGRR